MVSGKQRVNDNFIDELLNIADYEVVNGEFIPLIKGTKERLMDDVRNPISAQDLFKKVGMDYYDVKMELIENRQERSIRSLQEQEVQNTTSSQSKTLTMQ